MSFLHALDVAKSWAFPLAGISLVLYPVVLLLWTIIISNQRQNNRSHESDSEDTLVGSVPVENDLKKLTRVKYNADKPGGKRRSRFCAILVVLFASCALTASLVSLVRTMPAFTALPVAPVAISHSNCEGSDCLAKGSGRKALSAQDTFFRRPPQEQAGSLGSGSSMFGVACLLSGGLLLPRIFNQTRSRSVGSRQTPRRADPRSLLKPRSLVELRGIEKATLVSKDLDQVAAGTQYPVPADAKASMWHHVDLHVKTWLDEPSGLYRYVNEIPRGALQKFELQTKLPGNVIREDERGSKGLAAYGQPVPFNYGCFPQTYRDPDHICDVCNAPGDDDPLDVVELTCDSIGVGEVAVVRVLGAVCLVDEGEADWKILVVNTKANSPLASACSVEDVERLAPGRIEQAFRWMDLFKEDTSESDTALHYEVHSAAKAIEIIELDHQSWRRLLREADSHGYARGHWMYTAHSRQRLDNEHALRLGWKSRFHESVVSDADNNFGAEFIQSNLTEDVVVA